jgi:hypothetical protein
MATAAAAAHRWNPSRRRGLCSAPRSTATPPADLSPRGRFASRDWMQWLLKACGFKIKVHIRSPAAQHAFQNQTVFGSNFQLNFDLQNCFFLMKRSAKLL